MKEYTKRVILLSLICIFTLVILVVAIKLNEKRKIDISSTSRVSKYLTEIKYEEVSTYVTEQPNAIIYVSNSSEKETNSFERIFIPVVKKYNLENNIVYININNQKLADPFYQNAPELIFYENANVIDLVSASTIDTQRKLIKVLKERSVIGD